MRSIFLSLSLFWRRLFTFSIVVFQEVFKEHARACRRHGNAPSQRPSSFFGSLDNFQPLYIYVCIKFFSDFFMYLRRNDDREQRTTPRFYIFPFLKSLRHQCRVTQLIRIQRKCTRKPGTCLSRGFGGFGSNRRHCCWLGWLYRSQRDIRESLPPAANKPPTPL